MSDRVRVLVSVALGLVLFQNAAWADDETPEASDYCVAIPNPALTGCMIVENHCISGPPTAILKREGQQYYCQGLQPGVSCTCWSNFDADEFDEE